MRAGVRFILLGDARTGSNLLQGALNSNPEVRCFREIFHNEHTTIDYAVAGFDGTDEADIALRAADPARFMRERIFGAYAEGVRAVGFKYLYGHFWGSDALTEAIAGDEAIRVVHLKRRNQLRRYVSLRMAEATGRWLDEAPVRPPGVASLVERLRRRGIALARRAGFPARKRPARPRLRLTREECLKGFAENEREVARIGAMFDAHPQLTLWYEDILRGRDEAFGRVQRFLGVEPVRLAVTLRRQNPEPLRDIIENYDELRAALADTPYASCFEGE
jgi:hypothetical protein